MLITTDYLVRFRLIFRYKKWQLMFIKENLDQRN